MLIRKRRLVLAVMGVALGIGGTRSWAAEPSQQDLQGQVQALQAKVEALEAKQTSAKDVDATVTRVLQDADRRSQLMSAEGFTAGYTSNKGFVIQSSDGEFLWHPYLQFQLRNETNYRADQKSADRSETDNGFEIRRAKFGFDGNAYSKDLTYQFQWATDRSTGTPSLEDAWAKYKLTDNWSIKGGQFKDPLFRESLVSSMKNMAVERTLLNELLEGGDNYIQGLSLGYEKDKFRAEVAFTDGFKSANTNFQDPSTNAYDFGVAGRVEYMVMGDSWKNYGDYTAMGKSGDMLVVGAASDLSQNGDTNVNWHTADVTWLPGAVEGLSLFGAYTGRYTTTATGASATSNDSYYDWGFVVQASYMLTKKLEPFVRYDYIRADADLLTPTYREKNISEFTGGVNYYLHGQNAKLTADVVWLPNGSPANDTGAGILQSRTNEDQVVLRLQFQLVL